MEIGTVTLTVISQMKELTLVFEVMSAKNMMLVAVKGRNFREKVLFGNSTSITTRVRL